jgi:hypothetical protein
LLNDTAQGAICTVGKHQIISLVEPHRGCGSGKYLLFVRKLFAR